MKTREAPPSWPARWSTSAPTPACDTVALLTDMSTPLGLTAGNALEVRESVEVLAGGGPARRRRAHPGAGRGDARRRRARRRRPGRRARRRPGDGRLAPDDRGAGRRPGRAAARGAGDARGASPAPTGVLSELDALPSGSPRGGSAPAARARRTRCRPAPASSCTPSRATRCAGASRCSTLHTDEPERFDRAQAALRDGSPIAAEGPPSSAALVIDRIA